MTVRATIYVTVPIEIQAATRVGLEHIAKEAAEELHVGFWGAGQEGYYEARAQDEGRRISYEGKETSVDDFRIRE